MTSFMTLTMTGPFGGQDRSDVEPSEIGIIETRRRLWGHSKAAKRKNRQRLIKNRLVLKENVVINLSQHKLSMHDISALNKGLGFVPATFRPSIRDIDRDVIRFERKLQLHYFFKSKQETKDPHVFKKAFEQNPDWWPKSLNGQITKFCTKIKCLLYETRRHRGFANLTPKEIAALKSLSENRQLVIKKCDKGGGIAVMDSSDYVNKIDNMLNDTHIYTRVEIDDAVNVKGLADELINKLGMAEYLSAKQVQYLTRFIPRCPIFYGLPKVHKKGCPLRPIVSQINGPTCKINEYVDKLLFVAEKCIPFLLQDTTAYLQFIAQHRICAPNTLLVTLDVASLYTNIPHDEGAELVCTFYEETLDKWQLFDVGILPVDKELLNELILFILQNCTFEFNHCLFKQNFGTTMGARFSVKFANIYMHMWFRKYLALYQGPKPDCIARLVDDCFFPWHFPAADLSKLMEFLNTCHPSIKFECQFSQDRVTFLDTVTYIENGVIKTTVYTKPTDKKQYLYFSSCHPTHVTRSIPYSQAIRYRRIVEDDDILNVELCTLKQRFINRGYPLTMLNEQIDKARSMDRLHTLRYKNVTEKRANFDKFLKGRTFLPLIVTYHGGFRDGSFRKAFVELWKSFCTSDRDIQTLFEGEFPQLVFKRGRTIGNIVTSTRFKTFFNDVDKENIDILTSLLCENAAKCKFVVSKCDRPRCLCCEHIIISSSFLDSAGRSTHFIDKDYDCCSSNIIYLIKCQRCNVLYVGQTARQLKDRLNNHRSDVRLCKETAIGCHFNEPFHSVADLRIMPIHDVSHVPIDERYVIENQFMDLLHTKYPKGLNNYPLVNI